MQLQCLGVLTILRTDKIVSLCLVCLASNVTYKDNLLSFWESGIWSMLDRECRRDQPPIKMLNADSLIGFLGEKHLTHITAFFIAGERK